MAALLASTSLAPAFAQTDPQAAPPAKPARPAVATKATPAGKAAPKKAAPPKSKPPPSDEDDEDDPIIVTAHKIRPQPGAVIGDIKPEVQFSAAEVQSFGVSTVTELLNELAPETRSDRGRGGETPVVLLNGRRISSFNEIQNIPTEAILRVDILPEEVSLKYGYTADQRVVNIVLRRRFRAITGEAVGGGATEGGYATGQAEADLLHLRGDARLNLDLKYQQTSNLTEADRGLASTATGAPYDIAGNVVSPISGTAIDPNLSALVGEPVTVAGVPMGAGSRTLGLADFAPTANTPNTTDVSPYRTLLPATKSVTANAVMSQPIFWGMTATVNGTLGATSSDALQGLPGVGLAVPEGDPFSPFSEPVTVDRYATNLGPLRQNIDGWTAHLGSTLNRDVGDWRLSLTNAYDHADTQTDSSAGVNPNAMNALLGALSPTFNPFAPLPNNLVTPLADNTARSITNGVNVQLLANGPLLKVPAGQLYVSAKMGDTGSWLDSNSYRMGVDQAVNLSRNDANAQLNFDLPLASASHKFLPWFGELSVNVNTAVDALSDFGTLKTLGYGVNWTPVPGYNLIVSHTNDHAAPTIQQLGNPEITTPDVRLFDYTTGQTVDVTQLTGGNTKLTADTRNVMKVGLTIKPFGGQDFTLTANYIKSDIKNPIATFPAATEAIEAAFPERFIRDAGGELLEEDDRPVNYASQDRSELRWGFNYSRPIGPQPQRRFNPAAFRQRRQGEDAEHRRAASAEATQGTAGQGTSTQGGGAPTPGADGSAPGGAPNGGPGGASPPDGAAPSGGNGGGGRAGGGGRGGGRGFGGGGGGLGGGRLQFAVYHTIYFTDQILVRQGGPVLDFLNGAPASSSGGQPQQELDAQLGFTMLGFGARMSATWQSGTFVSGGGGRTGDLTFSDLGTINFRLFDNLGQQPFVVHRYPWLRGARVTLNIVNLFDQRISVKDSAGATPLIYQSAYLSPAGRTITLSLRKLFY